MPRFRLIDADGNDLGAFAANRDRWAPGDTIQHGTELQLTVVRLVEAESDVRVLPGRGQILEGLEEVIVDEVQERISCDALGVRRPVSPAQPLRDRRAVAVVHQLLLGFAVVENKVHVHDLHATILHLMGINHEKLTYRYSGRDFRLTDVSGNVVKSILT